MATFADMAPSVLQNLPQCPQPVVESYLLRAMADFCRKSYAWVETLAAVAVLPAAFPYAIVPDGAGEKVVAVFGVEVDGGDPLEKVTIPYLDVNVFDWKTATGTPTMFTEGPAGTIRLISIPESSVSLVSTIAVEPSTVATVLPDDLVRENKDTIVSGAISLLALIPKMPWFSLEFASFHGGLFNQGVAVARRDFNLHQKHATMVTSPSPI